MNTEKAVTEDEVKTDALDTPLHIESTRVDSSTEVVVNRPCSLINNEFE
mgnify:CR=1 FL=1